MDMSRRLICLCFVLPLGLLLSLAAVDRGSQARAYNASGDLDVWQRIAFRPSASQQKAPQIKVAIQTSGPSMQGLVRIPGGLASNFDTGRGLTVVDLINPGDETKGYTAIVAIEIAFTQSAPGQTFHLFAPED